MISTLTKLFFRMTERLTDEQLRDIAAGVMISDRVVDLSDAMAIELLALRARNAQLEEALKTGWGDKVDALRARVAKLEAALKHFAQTKWKYMTRPTWIPCWCRGPSLVKSSCSTPPSRTRLNERAAIVDECERLDEYKYDEEDELLFALRCPRGAVGGGAEAIRWVVNANFYYQRGATLARIVNRDEGV